MFLVFNKQKIYTYVVSLFTVLILFGVATVLNQNQADSNVQTSSSVTKMLPIYNVKTDEKKIAFTMNCAW